MAKPSGRSAKNRRGLTPTQWLMVAAAVVALLWYAARSRPTILAGLANTGDGRCDPSYPTVCIPPPPPDLDCRSIAARRFAVRPPDQHGLDADGDGVGCE